jgi:F-type H+-transporting ATPase subunit delta
VAVSHRMYARSLFEAARDNGSLDVVHEQLGDFAAAIADVPELRQLLANPELDPQQKAGVLGEILGDADELVRNFVLLTAEKGRAGEIEEIYRELDSLVAAEQRRLTVALTTAYELSDDEADAIVKKIETSSGRSVEATRTVDPALIGGIVLQVGSHRLDASVRGRLDRLRHELLTRS